MTNSPDLPSLDLAIATHQPQGIERVAAMNLPVIDGVRYIVSWQNHCNAPIPEKLKREDVEIHRFDRQGQSYNRNNAFEHCNADIILCTDDDLTLYPNALKEIRILFKLHPEVDVYTFRYDSTFATKYYPSSETVLGLPLPKNYSVCCFEIAFRRKAGLRCHPLLGLGSPNMHAGEDEILLLSAIKRKLNCRFYPLTICRHDHPTTGVKSKLTNKNLQGLGCVITLMYPKSALLRIPLKAWRVNRKGQASLLRALWYLSAGAFRAPRLLPDKKYLW